MFELTVSRNLWVRTRLGGHRRADTIAKQRLSRSQQAVKPSSKDSNDELEDIITGGESEPPSDDETSSTQDLNQPIKPKTRHKPQAPAGQIGGHRGETGSRDKAQIGTRNQATPPKTPGSTPLTSGTVLKGGKARKPPNKTAGSPNKADSNKNPMRLEGSGKDIYEIMEEEAKQSEAGRKSTPSKENIHHNTDRATSNGILGAEPKGSFLIRDSSLEGRIAISYNVDHGTTTHRLLEPEENNEYSVNLGDDNQGKIIKGTIPDIINQLGGDEKHVKPSAEQRSAPAPQEGKAGSRVGPDATSKRGAEIWRLPEENEQASGAENKGETAEAPPLPPRDNVEDMAPAPPPRDDAADVEGESEEAAPPLPTRPEDPAQTTEASSNAPPPPPPPPVGQPAPRIKTTPTDSEEKTTEPLRPPTINSRGGLEEALKNGITGRRPAMEDTDEEIEGEWTEEDEEMFGPADDFGSDETQEKKAPESQPPPSKALGTEWSDNAKIDEMLNQAAEPEDEDQ